MGEDDVENLVEQLLVSRLIPIKSFLFVGCVGSNERGDKSDYIGTKIVQ